MSSNNMCCHLLIPYNMTTLAELGKKWVSMVNETERIFLCLSKRKLRVYGEQVAFVLLLDDGKDSMAFEETQDFHVLLE